MIRYAMVLAILLAGAAHAVAPSAIDLSAARASMAGRWTGQLEYLDYGANKWFGIPVTTLIEDQRDGATTIRKSDFDDGPKVGNVRITTIELFDPAKSELTTATFRKGKQAELTTYAVRLDSARDATHWQMVEETKGLDADRPARLRLTTVRDGDGLQTLKEVDFLDDAGSVWLTRNRVTLKRVG